MKEVLILLLVLTLIFFMFSAVPFMHAADASNGDLQMPPYVMNFLTVA